MFIELGIILSILFCASFTVFIDDIEKNDSDLSHLDDKMTKFYSYGSFVNHKKRIKIKSEDLTSKIKFHF